MYLKCIEADGKYYCKNCVKKFRGNDKLIKTILKKSKSFEQWCIENNRQDVLDRWDYELNDSKPNEVCYRASKQIYFKCPKGIHESELKLISSFTSRNGSSADCNKCNTFAQYLIDLYGERALDLYWDYEKNTVNPWEINKGSKYKAYIKCQQKYYHESYKVCCNDFVSKNCRCPYCVNNQGKVHPLDSLGKLLENKELLHVWSAKNKKTPYDYTPKTSQEVWWECENGIHEDYYRSIGNSNKYEFRCHECIKERDESFLQEKVRLYLNELGYTILHENKCNIIPKNPKTKHIMPFDNEVKELKLICEVHGIQHYYVTGFHDLSAKYNNKTPKEELHYQQLKDRYKRMYAKFKGYEYLEIPYWTDNEKETWKKLINDKISKILMTK